MKLFGLTQRDDDLVRLKVFDNPASAHSLRILLEASGIQAMVTGEETNATFGGIGLGDAGVVGVQVMVRRADLEDAKLVMLEVPAASEILVSAWNCSCGEEVDEGFFVCWSCGSELEEHADPDTQ